MELVSAGGEPVTPPGVEAASFTRRYQIAIKGEGVAEGVANRKRADVRVYCITQALRQNAIVKLCRPSFPCNMLIAWGRAYHREAAPDGVIRNMYSTSFQRKLLRSPPGTHFQACGQVQNKPKNGVTKALQNHQIGTAPSF